MISLPSPGHHPKLESSSSERSRKQEAGHGVAAHLIAHAPRRIAHAADFHVHIQCTARNATSGGFGTIAQELLQGSLGRVVGFASAIVPALGREPRAMVDPARRWAARPYQAPGHFLG